MSQSDHPREPLPGHGLTSSRLRNHNERAVLTALREQGAMASSELARALNLSAQTASVLTRSLEKEGLLRKGEPVKGKVGKPQVPVALHPDGAYGLGLRIGRRGADLILLDLAGNTRHRQEISYKYPMPALIEDFVGKGIETATAQLSASQMSRIAGLGIAVPFNLWSWLEGLGAPGRDAEIWRGYRFEHELARLTDLEIRTANDINMACNGELVFGSGRTHRDFAYFYVGSFVGGGIALNGKVFHGRRGNAGAFGSIPVGPVHKPGHQLIHNASLYVLEQDLARDLGRPVNLRHETHLWRDRPDQVDAWLERAATALAKAAAAVIAVLDFDTVILDGGFPADIRAALVERTIRALDKIDRQGINAFDIHEGQMGREAGALGAAFQPLLSAHFLEGSSIL